MLEISYNTEHLCKYLCMHVWICSFYAFWWRDIFNNFELPYPLAMSNQELINTGTKTMNETDQAIERTKKVNNVLKHEFSSNDCVASVIDT